MKKSILSLFVVAALSLTVACKNDKSNAKDAEDVAEASADATPYLVDLSSSRIDWIGSKPAGKHNGTIELSSGEIFVKDGAIESGNFVIDMNSILVLDLTEETGKADLEAHLKGSAEGKEDHFFDVANFPEGKFALTSVNTVDGVTTINGNLTLKDVTKNVSFPATISVDDSTISLTSESFMINRTDWGINFMSKSFFDDLKDKFINDDIELKVTVVAKR